MMHRDAAPARLGRVVAFFLPCLLANPVSAERADTTLALAVHVAAERGQPVVDQTFIQRQLARANAIFAPYGVAFRIQSQRRLEGHAAMETRGDRDALGAHVRAGAINCFFVKSLRDVDEPEHMRRGVHWRSRTHEPAHYVIVSSISFDAVLAHELGHFLGNHRHSNTSGNLMSYQHTEVLPFLDAAQVRRMRRTLRRYLKSGELRPADVPESGRPPREALDSADGAPPQSKAPP